MTLTLTPEETAALAALAIRFDATPEQILTGFASDLTGSLRSSGSDERDRAMEYVTRAYYDRQASYCDADRALSEHEKEQIERLQLDSWRLRETPALCK
jgi:hypothetical protein